MIFNVHVRPRARGNRVEQIGNTLRVYLTKPALDGLANTQLIDLLSAHFKIRKHQINIKTGARSRNKLVEIDVAL